MTSSAVPVASKVLKSMLVKSSSLEELQSLVNYYEYELRESAVARKLLGKIKNAIMGLAELPERQAIVKDERLAYYGIRKLIVDSQIIFYSISEKDKLVTVIRILHGRRGWLNILHGDN